MIRQLIFVIENYYFEMIFWRGGRACQVKNCVTVRQCLQHYFSHIREYEGVAYVIDKGENVFSGQYTV